MHAAPGARYEISTVRPVVGPFFGEVEDHALRRDVVLRVVRVVERSGIPLIQFSGQPVDVLGGAPFAHWSNVEYRRVRSRAPRPIPPPSP